MTGEKSRYVFEEDEPGSVNSGKVEEGVGEAGPGSLAHASSLAGDGEVLAGEAAGPEGCSRNGIVLSRAPSIVWVVSPVVRALMAENACGEVDDASEVRDSRPSLGEDRRGVGVDLGEADGSPSGSLQPKVKASDPREEGCVGEVIHRPRTRVTTDNAR
jgi:hypothetical protein